MGLFGKSKTAGDKARDITIAETSGRKILFEIAGNNRYLVITPDILFVGSLGISSGSFGGKTVKRIPIDLITSVDVKQSALMVEMEIVFSGSGEINRTNTAFMERVRNENMIAFPKKQYDDVQKIAAYILELRQYIKNSNSSQKVNPLANDIPAQIRQLAELKDAGIISAEEFEFKKRELLSRM
jgi:hypothetical protein